ncbi:hypothetical protein ABZ608_39145 [Streptomyces sp. NPDC013172]|uniref:hypothetical protein n=1 Tax=Streptomyces sp. NPDC013172 TaxID=3155009 RepID=UPI0033C69325
MTIGTGIGLGASGALTAAPSRPAAMRVAPVDASSALTATADPTTQVYASAALSGTPLGPLNSSTVIFQCRSTTGSGIQILFPTGPGGIGYIPAPSNLPSTLADCPTSGTSGSASSGTRTAAQCYAQLQQAQQETAHQVLMSEFIKNWIRNNAERWAKYLADQGVSDPTSAPADSQFVSDAINSVHDETNAFAEALQTALQQNTQTAYPDCNDQTDGQDARWKDDTFQRMADAEAEKVGRLTDLLLQVAKAVAAEVLENGSQSGGQQSQDKDQNGCNETQLKADLASMQLQQLPLTVGIGYDTAGVRYQFQSGYEPSSIGPQPKDAKWGWSLVDRARTRAFRSGWRLTANFDHAETKMAAYMFEKGAYLRDQGQPTPAIDHVCLVINYPTGLCSYADGKVSCRLNVPVILGRGQELDVYWQDPAKGWSSEPPLKGNAAWPTPSTIQNPDS